MPTPQEIEAYFNSKGQSLHQAGQNFINTNIDLPTQQKLAALQAASANPAALNVGASSTGMAPTGAASSNAPGMNIDDAMAQRQQLLNMQNAASAEKANEWNEPDLSSPQPRQFPNIQAKMKTGQPVTSKDIRQTLKGPQEVTPELEKKLGYGSQDDDEDDNNKAGSEEGSYGY
jgi:hypothetical protein